MTASVLLQSRHTFTHTDTNTFTFTHFHTLSHTHTHHTGVDMRLGTPYRWSSIVAGFSR